MYWLVTLIAILAQEPRRGSVNGQASDTTYQNRDRPFEKWVSWGSLSLLRVTFIACTTVGTNDGEGGAVYFASESAQSQGGAAFLNCTSCVFDNCYAASGFGAAIFYKSPTKTFVFDGVIIFFIIFKKLVV